MRIRPSACWKGILLAVALPLALGCGSQSTVAGKVTYNGKDVESGGITFTSVEGQGQMVGAVIENGRYQVTGLTPGKMHVLITGGPRVEASQSTPTPGQVAAESKAPAEDRVPPNAVGNGQTVDVHSGSQTLDFELKKPH